MPSFCRQKWADLLRTRQDIHSRPYRSVHQNPTSLHREAGSDVGSAIIRDSVYGTRD